MQEAVQTFQLLNTTEAKDCSNALVVVKIKDERAADVLVQHQQVLQRVAVGYVVVLSAAHISMGKLDKPTALPEATSLLCPQQTQCSEPAIGS